MWFDKTDFRTILLIHVFSMYYGYAITHSIIFFKSIWSIQNMWRRLVVYIIIKVLVSSFS